jgi:hypothetical protein
VNDAAGQVPHLGTRAVAVQHLPDEQGDRRPDRQSRFISYPSDGIIRPQWTWFTAHSQKQLEFEAPHNPFLRFDVEATCLRVSCRHP